MTKAVVVHLTFEQAGGAEAYCLRVVEILQQRFDEVVVFHTGPAPDVERLQTWFGTRLDSGKVRFEAVRVPRMVDTLRSALGTRLVLLDYGFLLRHVRRHAAGADLLISTWAELPVRAKRVIQTVHIPQYVTDNESFFYNGAAPKSGASRLLWIAYMQVAKFLTGYNDRVIGDHLTIVNSKWSADQFRRHYRARDVRPLYFGVDIALKPDDPRWVPFERRENNFVIIGRVAPSKRVETAIEIVDRLRALGHDVGLHIIGVAEEPYATDVRELVATRPWVRWHVDLDRQALQSLVVRQKWGIHCYHYEHYGFAPAELQALGCITFIHVSGGQQEIVRNPAQRYTTVGDAVDKIDAAMRSPELQRTLLSDGEVSARLHTIEAFRKYFDALLDEVMANKACG